MLAQQHWVNVLWLMDCPVLNYPANMRHLHNVVLMLARRLLWVNCLVFAGKCGLYVPLCAHHDRCGACFMSRVDTFVCTLAGCAAVQILDPVANQGRAWMKITGIITVDGNYVRRRRRRKNTAFTNCGIPCP